MKKIILMILVAMIPFVTMAQKRSKKGKNVKTEKISESNSSYEFMIITGYEMTSKVGARAVGGTAVANANEEVKEMMKSNSKIRVSFDFGIISNSEASSLLRNARNFRTMAAAVNAAANEGWDFVSSNIVLSGSSKIHYYYMKRDK